MTLLMTVITKFNSGTCSMPGLFMLDLKAHYNFEILTDVTNLKLIMICVRQF